MDREFEATFDSQGHFDIPADMRERHGFTNGARVRVGEEGNKVVLEAMPEASKKDGARKNITDLAGFLGKDSKALEILMEERKRDRDAEDSPFPP